MKKRASILLSAFIFSLVISTLWLIYLQSFLRASRQTDEWVMQIQAQILVEACYDYAKTHISGVSLIEDIPYENGKKAHAYALRQGTDWYLVVQVLKANAPSGQVKVYYYWDESLAVPPVKKEISEIGFIPAAVQAQMHLE